MSVTLRKDPAFYPPTPRSPLGLVMFAAWIGIDPGKVPPEYKGHTCPATMADWDRVGQAALKYLREQGE